MTVHFIGAGPGAADLITVRGLRLIQSCPVCLYAGSLVPEEIVKAAPEGARVVDTAPLHLDEIIAEIKAAFHEAVDDYLETCAGAGKQPERPFSGKVMFRISPEVHARAALAAQLAGKSLNQWAEEVLEKAAN